MLLPPLNIRPKGEGVVSMYEEYRVEHYFAIPHLASCWHISCSILDALQEIHDGFSPLASVASLFRCTWNGQSDGVEGTNILLSG